MINESSILEIKTKNLIQNYKTLSKFSKTGLSAAVIKANAYGLGSIKVFDLLYKNGCRHFFVVTINEALELRKKYKKGYIYVLNGIGINEISIFKKNNIIPIINSNENLLLLDKKLKNKKSHFKIGLHFDTGINRLGIPIKKIDKNLINKFNICIILSHLASADEKENKYNLYQNNNFIKSLTLFKNVKLISFSNSAATFSNKKFHYNLLRPGIALYGGYFDKKTKKLIKPVIILKAKILQIKKLNKGEYVGYNQTYRTKKMIKIAILGIGYADGIFRKLSNKGFVFYKKRKFNIIGRVSMDSITVDISSYKGNIKVGSYMEIINEKFDIEKMAKKCATISNEILTSISSRVKRIYK